MYFITPIFVHGFLSFNSLMFFLGICAGFIVLGSFSVDVYHGYLAENFSEKKVWLTAIRNLLIKLAIIAPIVCLLVYVGKSCGEL